MDHPITMDLNQIAVFVRVIESGSFTKAAKILRQPKSRVSRRIAALEKELGVSLLYRTTRQFSPTEAGRALYAQCRSHVYELESAANALQDNAHEVEGLLRVTTTVDVGSTLLGPMLAELATLHPKLRIELRLADDLVDLVKEGIDLAIRIGQLQDASLRAKPLGRISFILVASPSYLAHAPRLQGLADLKTHKALDLAFGPRADVWSLRQAGKREENASVSVHWRSNNPRVLLDLALAGQGIALLPEFLCIDAIKAGDLQRVLAAYATKPFPVHLVWPAQREKSPKRRAFVELATKRLAPYLV